MKTQLHHIRKEVSQERVHKTQRAFVKNPKTKNSKDFPLFPIWTDGWGKISRIIEFVYVLRHMVDIFIIQQDNGYVYCNRSVGFIGGVVK